MLELRKYQRDAIDLGIYQYYQDNSGNVLIVIPTAGGKSLIIAKFLQEVFEHWPDHRVLIVTHVKELINQNFTELTSIWPEAPAGINSAGLKSRDLDSQIIFAGIQSIHKYAYALPRIDLTIIDEAHLIPRTANTMYRKFLKELHSYNEYMRVIGLTATPFRLDSGMLHQGDDALFDAIGYEVSVRDLIKGGWLAPPRTLSAEAQIDTSSVGTRAGEFIPGELEAAATNLRTVNQIASEIVRHGEGRKGWLVFACGVKHAEMLRNALRGRGIVCESIFGHTKTSERDEIVRAFKNQEIQALSSMGVLTTGFNARHVDLIALARPTKSTGLYIQMVGRGLRSFSGKDNCLVLDFGGNIQRHGPIDEPRIHTKGGDGDGPAPVKFCPECKSACAMAARECLACGFEFPEREMRLALQPSQQKILLDNQPQWLDVEGVRYAYHQKPGGRPSLRVEYHCGLSVHKEWVCLQHDGYARERAVAWWQKRAPAVPVPNTIAEALANSEALRQPVQILVRPAGRFTEIVGQKL